MQGPSIVKELALGGFPSVRFPNTWPVSSFFVGVRNLDAALRLPTTPGLRRACLDVKPIIFFPRQGQHRFAKGTLDSSQRFTVCLLFLGATLCVNHAIEMRFQRCEGLQECRIAFVMHDPGPCAGREGKVGHVYKALQVTRVPRWALQIWQGAHIVDHPRAASGKGDSAVLGRFAEIQFSVRLAQRRADCRQLVQQPALELPWLHLVLLACEFVDYRYAHLSIADTVAQLGGQIPLDFLAAQATDTLQ